MTEQTRIAFIGAGNMAREHARAFKDIEGVVLAGIFSRTRARAEALAAEFGILGVFDSTEELYLKTRADLVVISVPELSVRDACVRAFKYDWKLLIEKPAGCDLAEAREIVAASKAAGRSAFVALNRRHYGSTLQISADLEADPGRRFIQISDQEDPERALAAGQPLRVTQNWMYANSIHIIDYLMILGRGVIEDVQVVVPYNPAKPEFAAACIRYSSGDTALYEALWNAPGPWTVSVTTASKRRELKPLERLSIQARGSRTLQPAAEDPWDIEFKAGLRRQAAEAVRAAHGEPSRLPSLEESLKTMELIYRIYGV